MSTWIDFWISASLLIVFWFIWPTTGPRQTAAFLADRNEAWVASHPETVLRILRSRWYAWSCYALGAINLTGLLGLQLGFWSDPTSDEHWQTLWVATIASVFMGGAYHGAMYWLFVRWLKRNVPLAERRQATLAPRSIEQFLTPRLRFATYAGVAAVPAAWLVIGVLDLYTSADFWEQLADLAVLSVVFSVLFSLVPHLSVARPEHMMDRAIGPAFRGVEVRDAFTIQLVPPAVGTIVLAQELIGSTPLEIQRGIQLGLLLLLVWACLKQIRASPAAGDEIMRRLVSSRR